jgi:hypothetical protein
MPFLSRSTCASAFLHHLNPLFDPPDEARQRGKILYAGIKMLTMLSIAVGIITQFAFGVKRWHEARMVDLVVAAADLRYPPPFQGCIEAQ